MVMKFKNCIWRTVLLIVLATFGQACADNNLQEGADLIITGARIFTSDKQNPWAEALAIKDGKFVYVGDTNGIDAYTSTNAINLDGALIIPESWMGIRILDM